METCCSLKFRKVKLQELSHQRCGFSVCWVSESDWMEPIICLPRYPAEFAARNGAQLGGVTVDCATDPEVLHVVEPVSWKYLYSQRSSPNNVGEGERRRKELKNRVLQVQVLAYN